MLLAAFVIVVLKSSKEGGILILNLIKRYSRGGIRSWLRRLRSSSGWLFVRFPEMRVGIKFVSAVECLVKRVFVVVMVSPSRVFQGRLCLKGKRPSYFSMILESLAECNSKVSSAREEADVLVLKGMDNFWDATIFSVALG